MMKQFLIRVAALTAGLGLAATLPAAAAEKHFSGVVVHISEDNVKVRDRVHHQTLSFLLVPHFDHFFSTDGKETYQMKSIHPGMYVRVDYDNHALGARHADRIILLNAYGQGVKKMGS